MSPAPRPGGVVEVALGERSYPIRIGVGTLSEAGEAIRRRTGASRAVVVTVPPVGRRYAATLLASLEKAGLPAHKIEVPDGEATKNLQRVAKLYDALLSRDVDRRSVLVALGGGMVGDLAGFVAATYLRGIDYVQVPTTYLAMIDSSIGGKTGVNLPQGKNLVGAFHQPRLVWTDIETLATLPRRQRAAGLAEMIKHAAIYDAAEFGRLERRIEALLEADPAVVAPRLARTCAIKAEVVSRDEREAGLRMHLNFGHTLAHAAETLSGYGPILHGEAVAMGMAYAARRSEELELAPAGTAERLTKLLERAGLPTTLPSFPHNAYLRALRVDKKRRDTRLRYVVLRAIGCADTVSLTPEEIMPPARRAASRRRRE